MKNQRAFMKKVKRKKKFSNFSTASQQVQNRNPGNKHTQGQLYTGSTYETALN